MERNIYDKSKIALCLRSSRNKIINYLLSRPLLWLSRRLFVELAGAGAIGKALSFFQILNKSKNSRVDKSRIIWFKNMNSFLYIVVFCQHFVKTGEAEKVLLRLLKFGEIEVIVFFECIKCYLIILIIATIHQVISSSDIRSYQSDLDWIDPL